MKATAIKVEKNPGETYVGKNEGHKNKWRNICDDRGLKISAWLWYTIGQRNIRGVFVLLPNGCEVVCDQERHLPDGRAFLSF